MNEVYAVLDIGSASIELLVGEIINSNLHVLFSKKVPSHGVKKGIIEDENLLVKNTPLRKEVYNVQTPQAFDKELILDYYEKYIQSDFTITDDSQLFEIFSNEKIKVVEGEYSNIKMTTPEDLIFARGFLED